MLKILQIIPNLRKGGAERLVLDICNELRVRNSVQIKLVTFSTINEYKELSDGIDWFVIPSIYIPSITGKPVKEFQKLQEFIDEYQPDIIHSHLWEAEMVSRQIHFPKAKWFSHFHDNMPQLGCPFSFSKKHITNLYERQLMLKKYKKCDNQFICISADTQQFATSVLPSTFKNSIHKLHNAIDVSRFVNKNKSKPNTLKLLTVGSLVDKKNQQFLVKVVQILKKTEPFVHLDILGDGPNYQSLQTQIEDLHLDKHITLHGSVSKVEQFLWQSAIYVHSATYEPFGLVLIESMAAGLPVVCLDGRGNRDIIEQGKNGYILTEADPNLFADKVLELWNNKDLYETISNYALKFASNYDIKEYCTELLGLYQKD
jgi:glycosyltransferase involved in cell wall biosynthesis